MDCSSLGEIHRESSERNPLSLPTDQVHLDPALLLAEECAVRELREVEMTAHLSIDPCEQIEIERRGYSESVVVRRLDDVPGLAKIGAEQQRIAGNEISAHI